MTGNKAKVSALFGVAVLILSIFYVFHLQHLEPKDGYSIGLANGLKECSSTIDNYNMQTVMSISDSQSLSLSIKTKYSVDERAKDEIVEVQYDTLPNGKSSISLPIEEYKEAQEWKTIESLKEVDEVEEPSCEVTVSLNAPAFKINPRAEKQTFIARGFNSYHNISWVLEPTKMGNHVAMVSVGSEFTKIPIVITNNLGIPLFYSELLAKIGFFLGPMLTLPWWLEFFKKRNSAAN